MSFVELLAALVELDLLLEELAVALLEHVRALVELLVARVQPALEVGELAASLAGLVLGLAHAGGSSPPSPRGSGPSAVRSRPTTMRAAFSVAALIDWLASWLRDDVAQAEPNGKADQRPKGEGGRVHLHPPIRPGGDRTRYCCV